MEDKVELFGKMSQNEISEQLNNSDLYIFSSNYETFSMICAESLCCGCPIIGPEIPAIKEYTNKSNSILIKNNNEENWLKALNYFIKDKNLFDRAEISKEAKKKFSNENIKNNYLNFIKDIL